MNKVVFALTAVSSLLLATAAYSDGNDHAGTWHNTGSDHQAGNEPKDTADDRHNFGGATAGGSNQNPTDGSSQPAND